MDLASFYSHSMLHELTAETLGIKLLKMHTIKQLICTTFKWMIGDHTNPYACRVPRLDRPRQAVSFLIASPGPPGEVAATSRTEGVFS